MDLSTIANAKPESTIPPATATKIFVDGLHNGQLQAAVRYKNADTLLPFINFEEAATKAIRLVEDNPQAYQDPRKRKYPTTKEEKQAWRQNKKARTNSGNGKGGNGGYISTVGGGNGGKKGQ